MADFAAQIKAWGDKVKRRAVATTQGVATSGFVSLIELSPILSQRFRDSWQASVNAPDLTIEADRGDSVSPMQTGEPPTAADMARAAPIKAAKLGEIIYITNDLDYAVPLNDGHSQKAPHPMIDLTVLKVHSEFPQIVAQAISANP